MIRWPFVRRSTAMLAAEAARAQAKLEFYQHIEMVVKSRVGPVLKEFRELALAVGQGRDMARLCYRITLTDEILAFHFPLFSRLLRGGS